MLAGRRDALQAELAALVGRQVELMTVEVAREEPGGQLVSAAPDVVIDRPLAAALLSAMLGFDGAAEVDLHGPAEAALLSGLAQALRRWVSVGQGRGDGAAAWVVLQLGVGSVVGMAAVAADWQALWQSVARQIRSHEGTARLSLERLEVEVEAHLSGPRMSAAELLDMGEGHKLVLGDSSRLVVTIVAGGVRVAVGKLGAVRGRKAVRVEQPLLDREGR